MINSGPVRRTSRVIPSTTLGLLALVSATALGVLGFRSMASTTGPAAATATAPSAEQTEDEPDQAATRTTPAAPPMRTAPTTADPKKSGPKKQRRDGDEPKKYGIADGAVPDGTTVFDDVPAVANLRPDLLRALREAARDAADDGVRFRVNSGWRSAAYQEKLLREAVQKYGSEAEAARWVAPPDKSLHVSGDAIDLGPVAAQRWLAEHGARYGLCRVYANEPWHFELVPDAGRDGCPDLYADAGQDPRLR